LIVSHKYRYVYVELPRTGSTAVSRELQDLYDGHPILRKHATYRDFLRIASEDERTYFAFSGIRNPLDVTVTRYIHLQEDKRGRFTDPGRVALRNSLAGRLERRIYRWVQDNDASFEDFLLRWYKVPYDTWAALDHKRMNAILRLESLPEDFDRTLRQIGIQPLRPLPVVNATPERDRQQDLSAYYTPRARRRARWVFGPYMEEWHYAFPPDWGPMTVPLWSKLFLRVTRAVRGVYWRYFRFADYVKRRPGGVLPTPDNEA
jgi:hypothetical protein